LSSGAARSLRDSGLTCPLRNEAGDARAAIVARAAARPLSDHHAHSVERQAGLGHRGGEHDLAAAGPCGGDARTLRAWLQPPCK
jgi:hypothetical protein